MLENKNIVSDLTLNSIKSLKSVKYLKRFISFMNLLTINCG